MKKEIIFVHNLKGGGSSVEEFIKSKFNLNELKRVKIYNLGNNNWYLHKKFKNKYLILNIRNPFYHYCSLCSYGNSALNLPSYIPKKICFSNFLRNLLILDSSNFYPKGTPEAEIMSKFDIGFISARIFIAIYGDKINSIKNGDDLLNNIPKMSNIHKFIKVEDTNINNHINNKNSSTNLKKYYDKDLFRLVRNKERYILDYFNYDKVWKNY